MRDAERWPTTNSLAVQQDSANTGYWRTQTKFFHARPPVAIWQERLEVYSVVWRFIAVVIFSITLIFNILYYVSVKTWVVAI
jgi:hypothetical protein